MVFKQLNEIEKQTEDLNKSNFTIELDLEKQVDSLLYDEDDDLNDAKYLENDKSNWSSTSNLLSSNFYNNQNQHNMTVPMPLSNNILCNQKYQTIESEEKINKKENILTPANSTIEINKKILGDKNKDIKNEKEFNLSILGDKNTDTITIDSNNNLTGNIIQQFNPGGAYFGLKNSKGEKENLINMTCSNTSSIDIHSNSFELNNINLIRGLYYTQTPNNSLYYNSNYFKNDRYNKFQQNYSQSQYLRDYYSNSKPFNKNNINIAKTFNNMNNNINFSELSSRASVQSLNNNKYNTINNYRNNMHLKIKDDINKSYNDNLKLMLKDQKSSKYIQKKIEEKSPEFLYKLYEQMKIIFMI